MGTSRRRKGFGSMSEGGDAPSVHNGPSKVCVDPGQLLLQPSRRECSLLACAVHSCGPRMVLTLTRQPPIYDRKHRNPYRTLVWPLPPALQTTVQAVLRGHRWTVSGVDFHPAGQYCPVSPRCSRRCVVGRPRPFPRSLVHLSVCGLHSSEVPTHSTSRCAQLYIGREARRDRQVCCCGGKCRGGICRVGSC